MARAACHERESCNPGRLTCCTSSAACVTSPIASKPTSNGGCTSGVYFPAVKLTSLALTATWVVRTAIVPRFKGVGRGGTGTMEVAARKFEPSSLHTIFLAVCAALAAIV